MANTSEWFRRSPHRPPDSDTPAPNVQSIYMWQGAICQQWELTEQRLYLLYAGLACKNKGDLSWDHTVTLPYKSMRSASARMDLVEGMVKFNYPDGAQRKHYRAIITSARRSARLRAQCAHGVTTTINGDGPYLISSQVEWPREFWEHKFHEFRYNDKALREISETMEAVRVELSVPLSEMGFRFSQP